MHKELVMATITIRNLDESVKRRLRMKAASHNQSMEEEARIILQNAVHIDNEDDGIGSRIHLRFKEAGGIEMPEPNRAHRPRKADID
jgi:plasmid stability protein